MNYFGTGDYLPIPRIEWGVGMAHKTIRGGLCPGGRLRMERLLALIKYGRVDPSKMISHRLKGFDAIPEALELMRRKDLPDLCKPIVVIEE